MPHARPPTPSDVDDAAGGAAGVRVCIALASRALRGRPFLIEQSAVAVARLARLVLPGHLHLIIHRGRVGQRVFEDASDLDHYLDALGAASAATPVAIHAYAMLANEVRIAVTPSTAPGLATLMQAVGRRYVRMFNRAHARTGSPWEGRFRSTVIEARPWFLECLRFVEAAGSGDAVGPETLLRSSLPHHLGHSFDPLITEHADFWSLGNTPFERHAAYRRFVERGASASHCATLTHAALHGWALGSGQFASEAFARTGRRVRPALSGRPRKKASITSL